MNNNILIKNIRNFCIISHVDHGKSTLSNAIVNYCNNTIKINIKCNLLDNLEIEKEKGITIKSKNLTLFLNINSIFYKFNLIDTPGHDDFSYEVSRVFKACDGIILVIDASKGIQSQTISNYYLALKNNLKIIPVINKIDLYTSKTKYIINELKEIFNINPYDCVLCSAKYGYGIDNLINKIINIIPNPKGNINNSLQALIIDLWFDNYLGVIFLVVVKEGIINVKDKIKINNEKVYTVNKIGILSVNNINVNILSCGDIGWISCLIKSIENVIGYTIVDINSELINKREIIKYESKLFSSFFPENINEYNNFCKAFLKISSNDLSISYKKEYSDVLGFGFICGFLGKLHMEIVKERLKKEYNIDVIVTPPNVCYEILTKDNKIIYINNLNKNININNIKEIREPISICSIFTPLEFVGKIIKLCSDKRGIQLNYINNLSYIELIYNIPINEIITNFSYEIKSISKGYASINYRFDFYKKDKLVILQVIINGKIINTLTTIIHENNVKSYAFNLNKKLNELIFRKQYNIIIQISVNSKIILKSVIKQFRKNVIDKCYGGDISRKKKLLEKQKIGKKKMKKLNNLNLTNNLFKSIFNINKNE